MGRRLRGAEQGDAPGRPASRVGEERRGQRVFATLDSGNRYAILYQIQDAKKPETRARRIEKYVAMLNGQKKIYP